MVKKSTQVALRKSAHPLFVSIASDDTAVTMAAFTDKSSNNIIVSNGTSEDVHSPLTGQVMTKISVENEVEKASGVASTPVDKIKAALVEIAKCTSEKCKCSLYTTSDVAKILTANEEKVLHCTACGAEMVVASSEDDVEGDVSEDDDEFADASDAAETDEDEIDPDASDEDEDDASDVDEEVTAEAEDEDEDESEGEDEDSADEGDDEGDEEVASYLAMLTASEEETVEDVESAMHRLVKPENIKLIVAGDKTYAMAGDAAIGVLTASAALPKYADTHKNANLLHKSVSVLIANGGLDQAQPSQDLIDLGFQPIPVTVPVSSVLVEQNQVAIDAKAATAVAEATAVMESAATNFNKLVEIASIGMAKGIIDTPGNTFVKDLAKILATAGVKDAAELAGELMTKSFGAFVKSAVEQAKELSKKGPDYVAGMAQTIATASYTPVEVAKSDVVVSTAIAGAFTPSRQVAEVASHKPHPEQRPDFRGVFSRMGRR